MQSSIPRQIANKLVFDACLLLRSIGIGQEHGINNGCMVGYCSSNSLDTNTTCWVKVTHLKRLTVIRMQRKKACYFLREQQNTTSLKQNKVNYIIIVFFVAALSFNETGSSKQLQIIATDKTDIFDMLICLLFI